MTNTPPLVDYVALHAAFEHNCLCGPETGPCAGHTALMDPEIVSDLRFAQSIADRLRREEGVA